ncbi:MAG TPA: hypothetical protein VGQ38_07620 [Gaiellaceae bacterium]|nr:hypothetical protein [Gaiellaceae bacterium]
MRGRPVSELLALPVRIHGIHVGRPTALLVDRHADRLLGFEVACGDGAQRFLPFSVANVRPDEIALDSALVLIDERDLAFYRSHSRRLDTCGYASPEIDEHGEIHEALNAA